MEIEKYQAEYKKEVNKIKDGQLIVLAIIICVIILLNYFFEFDQEKIKPYINPVNIGFILLIVILRLKFARGLKCPRCKASLVHQRRNRRKYLKRCCGNCGLLLLPDIKLVTFKNTKFIKQSLRPGFLKAIIIFGITLSAFGFYIQNRSILIGGLASVGFIFMIKFLIPSNVCNSCGNPKREELKFCEYCGDQQNGMT